MVETIKVVAQMNRRRSDGGSGKQCVIRETGERHRVPFLVGATSKPEHFIYDGFGQGINVGSEKGTSFDDKGSATKGLIFTDHVEIDHTIWEVATIRDKAVHNRSNTYELGAENKANRRGCCA